MTEKSYNPKQKEKKAMKGSAQAQVSSVKSAERKQEKKIVKKEVPKVETKTAPPSVLQEGTNTSSKPQSPKLEDKTQKTEGEKEKPEEKKKKEVVKIKKDKAVVNGKNVPISTKYAVEICKFIKYKPIDIAINNLEQVLAHKKAIPMKGEYGHKKGKRMAGGKYPKKATEHFIKLLKSLSANAIANSLDEPIISEAVANIAPRPRARFGRWQRKRTHVKIVAREKKVKSNKKVGGKKK